MEAALLLAAFVAGFVASIFAWPILRKVWYGAAAEAERLRAKAREIEAAVRARL